MQKSLMLSVIILGAVASGGWLNNTAGAQTDIMAGDADIVQGEELYIANCAACHGANLEGQPDWRSPGSDGILPAPPHDETGHTWHHSDSVLFDYTRLGGKAVLALQGIEFESGMPGFGDQLSDAQIWNIIAYIKSTWPERQRAIQATRNAAPRQ